MMKHLGGVDKKGLLSLVVGIVCVVLLGSGYGCGSSSSTTTTTTTTPASNSRTNATPAASSSKRTQVITRAKRGTQVRAVPWHGRPKAGSKSVVLTVAYNWCTGSSRPRIQRVSIVERHHATVLTVFAAFPPSGGSEAERLRQSPVDSSCPQIRFIETTRVTLEHVAFDQVLYDGSTSPPTKRWPKP